MYSIDDIKEILIPEIDFTGYPTDVQLEIINRYAPSGMSYVQDEVLTVAILGANNLLKYNLGAWDISSLETMSKSFIGKPFTIDHDWCSVKPVNGLIYDARVIKSNTAPQVFMDMISSELNQMIIDLEGFCQVIFYAFVPSQSKSASDIKYRLKNDVSIGGFAKAEFYCPLCSSEYGEMVSFEDERCPHWMPCGEMDDDDDDSVNYLLSGNTDNKKYAPFFIQGGFTDAIELSAVLDGNCPSARII
jgi:hypothetical protein